MTAKTPQRVDVAELFEWLRWIVGDKPEVVALSQYVAAQAAEIERLKVQFAPQPMDAVELIVGERDDVALTITTTVGEVRRYRAAERAREEACGLLLYIADTVPNSALGDTASEMLVAFLAANGGG